MEKENRIRLQYCPNCGKTLKITGDVRKLICPACAIPVRPIHICPSVNIPEPDCADGIANIRAAYSYARVFMDSFDRNSRILHKSFTFEETDALVNRFTRIAADDMMTWQLAFDCVYIPVIRKVQGFSKILEKIGNIYANNKAEALALFDSLQQAVAFIKNKQEQILQQLRAFTQNAQFCGADDALLSDLQKKIQNAQILLQELSLPKSAEDIDAVKCALDENNRHLSEQFAEVGIDLELEYRRIGNFLAQKQFKDAVAALERFKGYKNTKTLLKDVNRCYRFGEVLQITGRLYLEKGGNLYAIENGRPVSEPCVRGIAVFLGTYADRLFYADVKNKLFCADLSEKTTAEFDRKRTFPEICAVASDDPCRLYFTYRTKDGKGAKVLARLNPVSFSETVLYEDTAVFHGVQNGILVYTDSKGATFAADLADNNRYDICNNRIELCGFTENGIVYTRNAPTADNKNLYILKIDSEAHEQTLATNIRSLCCIADNTAYYTVGNKLCSALYAADLKNGATEQIAKSVHKIEHTDSDAVYFSIGDACNRTLIRIDTQNKNRTVLTDSLHKVIGMHCGELYYTDAESNLCSVLPDGTNRCTLFADVREVLMMHGEKLYFTAADEIQISRDEAGNAHIKELLSLYCINNNGTNLHKLAHGIADAQCFNSKEIDFFKNAPTADGNTARWLFRYNTRTDETFKLLEYAVSVKKGK